MATIKDWEEDLTKKDEHELTTISDALEALEGWQLFMDEFEGIKTINFLVTMELERKVLFVNKAATITI